MADLAAEAGSQQQGRGLDGPGGGHHRPGPDDQPVPARGAGLDPGRPAAGDQHPAGVGPHDQPGPGRRRLLQVGDHGRLLGPDPAAEAAPAAAGVLGAAADVAGQRAGVPAEPFQAQLQQLVAGAGAALVAGDPDPAGDRLKGGLDLAGDEGLDAGGGGPLGQDRRRGRERGRVVHHRAPAKGRPGDDPAGQVVGGQGHGVQVEVAVGVALGVGEVALGQVAALLEHDHLKAGPGQLGRGHPAAGPRPDHDHVAGQLLVALGAQRVKAPGHVGGRAERPRVAGGVAGLARPGVGGQQGQRAERGGQPPLWRQPLGPALDHRLGRGRAGARHRGRAAGEQQRPGPRVERPQQAQELVAVAAAGRPAQDLQHPAGHRRVVGLAEDPGGQRGQDGRLPRPGGGAGAAGRGRGRHVSVCTPWRAARPASQMPDPARLWCSIARATTTSEGGRRRRRRRSSSAACTGASAEPWCLPASTCASARASCTG